MYRKSSKGNPYHDAKGRFTSASGMITPYNTKTKDNPSGKKQESPVEMWSSFGEQHNAKAVLKKVDTDSKGDVKKAWEDLDSKRTNVATTDGRRHYHNRSIDREDYAKGVANYKIPKGSSLEERTKGLETSMKNFKHENRIALNNGAKFIPMYRGNEAQYQVVESNRMSSEVTKYLGKKNKESVTINTSTHMKQFSGYTVEYYGNNTVRSCKKGASPKEISEGIAKFCSKHKKDLSDKNTCIKIWRNGDRVYFMPVFSFKTEAEAKKFAEGHSHAKVVNHDDGSMS